MRRVKQRRPSTKGRKIDTLEHHVIDTWYKVDVYVMPDWSFQLQVQPDEKDKYLRRGISVENADLSKAIKEMEVILNALKVTTWEPRIAIWIDVSGSYRGDHTAGVELSYKKVDRGTSEDGHHFSRGVDGYVTKGWPSESRRTSETDGSRDIPYSDGVWEALEQAKANLEAAGKKLCDLIYRSKEKQLVAALLSGNALPAPKGV